MKKKEKPRELWLDFIKALGVIFIVCNHTGYSIHRANYYYVPIFFIVSGYVFKNKKFSEMLISKIKRLYVPFVVANTLFLIMHNILFYTGQIDTLYSLKDLAHNFLRVLLFDVPDLLGAPTWFIFALFVTNIEFLLLFKLTSLAKKNSTKILGIVSLIFFIIGIHFRYLFNEYVYGHCAIITMLFINMLFYYIGYMIKQKNIKEYWDKNERFQIISIILSVLILMVAFYKFNYALDYRVGFFSSGMLSMILPIAGFIWLTFVSTKIITIYEPIERIFKYIGTHTIDILLYHYLCFRILGFFQIHFFNLKLSEMYIGVCFKDNYKFIAILLGIIIPILTRYIIEKYPILKNKNK